MSRILTVIPARLGSTRFPGKVLAQLKGRPVIEWCWRAALTAKLGPVLIATDAKVVVDAVRRFGGVAVMTPTSCASGSDRVWLATKNRREQVIVNYQGDMPLLRPATLRAAVAALAREADIATAVIALDDAKRAQNPNVVKAVMGCGGRCLYFSRAAIPFSRNGVRTQAWEHLGVYAYRRNALHRFVSLPPSPLEKTESLEQLRALEAGMTIRAAIVSDLPVAVDVPADLKRAEHFLRQGTT